MCLCFGNIGGALQVDRILTILFSPLLFVNIMKVGCGYARLMLKLLSIIYFFMIISLAWTPDLIEAVKEIIYYFVHFLLFLEIIVFARFAYNPLKSISSGWLMAVLLCSMVAIWELKTGNHLGMAYDQDEMMNAGSFALEHLTASVTFMNYNSYNTFLCFSFPWIFYIMLDKSRRTTEKWLSLIALILSLLIMLINASRGSVLSAVIMFVIYYYFSKKTLVKNVITMFILFLALMVILYYGEEITAAFLLRVSDGKMFSDENRATVWMNALAIYFETFGVGVGIGGLQAAMKQYAPGGITITHNFLLEILVQYGIITTIMVVCYLIKIFVWARKVEISRKIVIMMSLLSMPLYGIIDSGYLLNTHLYILMATLYTFANYEHIRRNYASIRETA